MIVKSSAFADRGAIPRKYTCDGEDISPPLEWSAVPAGTKTLALICEDPDAPKPDFVHWVLFNVPADAGTLPEHVPARDGVAGGARQGRNDFGKVGYGGPCPPSGTHRYRFKLYAIDSALDLPAGSTRDEVLRAMKGHVLASAELTGAYTRAK